MSYLYMYLLFKYTFFFFRKKLIHIIISIRVCVCVLMYLLICIYTYIIRTVLVDWPFHAGPRFTQTGLLCIYVYYIHIISSRTTDYFVIFIYTTYYNVPTIRIPQLAKSYHIILCYYVIVCCAYGTPRNARRWVLSL